MDKETLINAIHKRDALWNKTIKAYQMKSSQKELLWQEVANECKSNRMSLVNFFLMSTIF
jgi:hypothetical protein